MIYISYTPDYIINIIYIKYIYYLRSSILSLLVVTQIRGHIAGSTPPPTHYGSCPLAYLSREDLISFFHRGRASNCLYIRSTIIAFLVSYQGILQTISSFLFRLSAPSRTNTCYHTYTSYLHNWSFGILSEILVARICGLCL